MLALGGFERGQALPKAYLLNLIKGVHFYCMLNRLCKPSLKRSFFLFGARSTGKSTLLHHLFQNKQAHFIDLLDPLFYRLSAKDFESHLASLPEKTEWVIVDEIQKSPEILNCIHRFLSPSNQRKHTLNFALTGSSARKLKRGGANLLAGRANVFNLYPLTHREVPESTSLNDLLKWGGLPQVVLENDPVEKRRILKAYTTTYLREEIAEEQLVRVLEPFHTFLPIAAQMNGNIVNYSAIAEDVRVSTSTIQTYFEILADTLIAIILPPYHAPIRKRQRTNPKIYFFDLGVLEALSSSSLGPSTYSLGNRFEHFVFLEIYRLQSYQERDWKFSFLRTKDDAEIDLIIERPQESTLLIEIKSSTSTSFRQAANLNRFISDFKNAEAFLLSNDPLTKQFGKVRAMHWREWMKKFLP
ncbi:ATP-binding protein [bacterium]|nr:ATP-binding protein [bacterium]